MIFYVRLEEVIELFKENKLPNVYRFKTRLKLPSG